MTVYYYDMDKSFSRKSIFDTDINYKPTDPLLIIIKLWLFDRLEFVPVNY